MQTGLKTGVSSRTLGVGVPGRRKQRVRVQLYKLQAAEAYYAPGLLSVESGVRRRVAYALTGSGGNKSVGGVVQGLKQPSPRDECACGFRSSRVSNRCKINATRRSRPEDDP